MARRCGTQSACALGVLALCGLLANGARAQSPGLAQVANDSAEEALQELSQRADVIFAGQVTAVRRRASQGGATGVVEIDFAVEDAVRGARAGQYTLREWAGLWPAGETPYRVGQQYLMLLHAPGASGLSSPVGGQDGAIPIRGGGAMVGPGTFGSVVTFEPAGQNVDLRWIATRVARPVVYAWVPVREPIPRPFGPSPMHLASPTEELRLPIAVSAENASQGAAYATVLAMLRGWQKDRHEAR